MTDKYLGGILAGATDVSLDVLLRDASDNTVLTGKSAGEVTGYYHRQGAAPVAITVSNAASQAQAHDDGDWIELSNMAGLYRFDVPDAVFAAGVDFATVYLKTASSYAFAERFGIDTGVRSKVEPAIESARATLADPANVESSRAALATDIAALDFATQAEVESAVESARATLADPANVESARAATSAAVQTIVESARAQLNEQIESARGDIMGGVDALPDVTEVENAVWDANQVSHVSADTMGAQMSAAALGGGGALTAASCASIVESARGDLETDHLALSAAIAGLSGASSPSAIADVVWDEVLTAATHNVATSAGRRLRNLQDLGLYEGGAVWIDTVNGVSGTTDFENGTVNNPVDNIADAKTIADSVGLVSFRVISGSTITLAATFSGYDFIGHNWTLALGAQAVNNALFRGATVSGTFTGTPTFEFCTVNALTGPGANFYACGLANTITCNATGDWFLDACFSKVAGSSTPIFDFSSGGGLTINLNMRHYSGGIEVRNIGQGGSTHKASIEGFGQVVEAATCIAPGVLNIRGNFKLTQNGTSVLTDVARMATDQLESVSESARSDVIAAVESAKASIEGTVALPADVESARAANAALIGALNDLSLAEVAGETESVRAALATDIAALNDLSLAQVAGETESARAALATDIAALNDPTPSAVADVVWDEAQSAHVAAGTMGAQQSAAAAGGGGGISAASVASAVWDASQASFIGAGTMGAQLSDAAAGTGGSAALGSADYSNIAAEVWDKSQANHVASGSMGNALALVSGKGDTEVDHNYPTSDNLRVLDGDSNPVEGVTVTAFLKTDYDAGNRGTGYVRGRTTTLDDGRWEHAIYLDTGTTYTIQFTKSGAIEITTQEITV
jgi:hypothetical protein